MPTNAVIVLFFNRPAVLERLLKRVEAAEPRRVYLACDGPRPGGKDDEAVEVCRRIVLSRAWRTEPITRFLPTNEGCARAVSGALDWFFEQEESGIVLEDDCLPDPTFFEFCTELLERYREDPRVMSINGTSFDTRSREGAVALSYRFSHHPSVWGWASWSRAWSRYRLRLAPEEIDRVVASGLPVPTSPSRRAWRRKFLSVSADHPATWDYQWTFAHFRERGLAAIPGVNLVSNVPTDGGAHMRGASAWQSLPTVHMRFPILHPATVATDSELDRHIETVHCNHRSWLLRKAWQIGARHGLVNAEQIRTGRILHW